MSPSSAVEAFTVPPAETPGSHEFAHVNGIRLHYIDAGPTDGPLVVLLHGFPEFWYTWRHVIPALAAAGYRVVAPDMRGYNRSEKPDSVRAYHVTELVADVVGLIERLDRQRAHLVGHDWGGGVAWEVAIRHPDIVDRLAVLNAPHPQALREALTGSPRQLVRSWYMFYFQVPWLPERVLTSDRLGVFDSVFEDANADAYTDTDLERYRAAFQREGTPRGALNYYRSAMRDGLRRLVAGDDPESGDVPVPTLVIWGEQDRALESSLLDDLDKWVPERRIERVPTASHWVHHDEPNAVHETLLSFLPQPDASG